MLVLDIVLDIEKWVTMAIWVVLAAVKVFALADALFRKDAYYAAADKQNKAFWLVLLVLAVVIDALPPLFDPIGLLPIIGTVAALVYLADVRPALREMEQYGK